MKKIFATLFLLFVVAEGGSRLVALYLEKHSSTFYYRQYLRPLFKLGNITELEGVPNAQAEIENPLGQLIHVRHNSRGWRDEEVQFQKFHLNALTLGDSFTYGVGVEESARYSNVLERKFPGLKIWNDSLLGGAADQYYFFSQTLLGATKWKFLIIQISNNDILDTAFRDWRDLDLKTGFPGALVAPPSKKRFSQYFVSWNMIAYYLILQERRDLDLGIRRQIDFLRKIISDAKEKSIPVVLMAATDFGEPAYGKRIGDEYRRQIDELVKETGTPLVIASPLEVLPFPDLHWTAASHEKAAEMLKPFVANALDQKPLRK